ncbi:MAG: hypothetical protein CO187_03070 [Zetaproteobacteria bacterium CG_4_9_14_3_um_filter_53_7]|nr:MAG: hypothetical protein CO187_03070 [Zetaproteobacteria bacterium CG_4_9_14_3_um_filter_53_7]
MSKGSQKHLVHRTCTRKGENNQSDESMAFESFRELSAFVLLGDPGAGKTESFKREAEESGGKYVCARDFVIPDFFKPQAGETIFIDGLDEVPSASDSRHPLDRIRERLIALGRPRFRLSCREADWLGKSGEIDMKAVSPDGHIVTLYLDELRDESIAEILEYSQDINDPSDFMEQAKLHGLYELLRNPQTLDLLIKAVGGKAWPNSRTEVYEMACKKLVQENNPDHKLATKGTAPSSEGMLKAAGYLSAVHLIAGRGGFDLNCDDDSDQFVCLRDLKESQLPLLPALKSNLFVGEEGIRTPVHRSVAEFLGARYISTRINDGLPVNRVLALFCGEDGGIIPDLRGLAAWIAAYNQSARSTLIERDALGVVLYGDVRNILIKDKQSVLNSLHAEAKRYPWFRSEDWADSPFGALGTKDMEPVFQKILSSPSRTIPDQQLLNCVLDALRYGEQMPSLAQVVESIARDSSYLDYIRRNAIEALIHGIQAAPAALLQLAEDIREGRIEDNEDELIGALLRELYPSIITSAEIFEYMQKPKTSTINSYRMFWPYDLERLSSDQDLPILLDTLATMGNQDSEEDDYNDNFERMGGKLLARGIEVHGDSISDERLLAWLSIGRDEFRSLRFEDQDAQKIASWFSTRLNRYKALIELTASQCATQPDPCNCMNKAVMRLQVANISSSLETWWLEKAACEPNKELAQFYFGRAIQPLLIHEGGNGFLPLSETERFEQWVDANPQFTSYFEPFISCKIGDWEQEHAQREQKWKEKEQKKKEELLAFYHEHIDAIRDGTAYPQILHDLALAYNGHLHDAKGDTPKARMTQFLGGDSALIEAATMSFWRTLDRSDLPAVAEIAKLGVEGIPHYIRPACLIGMGQRYLLEPEKALNQSDDILSRMLLFRLTDGTGDEPEWFEALVNSRPKLVADAFLAYTLPMLRAKKEHIHGLHLVTGENAYVEVARLTLPKLLESFPVRANIKQLPFILKPLLEGGLRYLNKSQVLALVERKNSLKSMDDAQRTFWLACGLLLEPETYKAKLFKFVGKSQKRRAHMASFLASDFRRNNFPESVKTPANVLAQLIEMLGQDVSDIRLNGLITNEMRMSEMVGGYIQALGREQTEEASSELKRLLGIPALSNWHNRILIAQHDQQIIRRKGTFRQPTIPEVDSTLADLQPANAADLAALVMDHLNEIARCIRDGNTNDYKQYWSYDEKNKKLSKPKPENDCRDALLSDLKERLGTLDIDAQPEARYADDKRADIRVSFGGTNGFSVPVEIKKDSHKDLWRSIREQLITKYTRDPDTDGFGIYLVFWFGGMSMPLPHDGKKPKTAKELKEKLLETLSLEERRKISVCVIDCALP